MIGRLLTAVFVAVSFGFVQLAAADVTVTVNCPGSALVTTDREFTLTTAAPGAICAASGQGNLSGNPDTDPLLKPTGALYGYTLFDKTDDSTSGLSPQMLTATPPASGLSGVFSFSVPAQYAGWTWALAMKSGNGVLNPDYAVFKLPPGIFEGSWAISGAQQLSHMNLYGLSPVPLPAAAWLFGSALLGLGVAGRVRTVRSG